MGKYTFLLLFLSKLVTVLSNSDFISQRTFQQLSLFEGFKPNVSSLTINPVGSDIQCAVRCSRDVTCNSVFITPGERKECALFDASFPPQSFLEHPWMRRYDVAIDVQTDCYDVMRNGRTKADVYTVQPRDNGPPIKVFCEEASINGGWLVIQRRIDGSVDFFRKWNEYKDGFGDLHNEFWLGNTHIYRLTNQRMYEMRVDLEDFEGNTSYALYRQFSLADENDSFRLYVNDYSGTAGNSLEYHDDAPFSTVDRDSSMADGNCAHDNKGAWWYKLCGESNLNGLYEGILTWNSWPRKSYSLKGSVMKIRPSSKKL